MSTTPTRPPRRQAPELSVVDGVVAIVKPRLRGWLHLWTFPVAVVAGLVLVALGESLRGRLAAAVYVFTAGMLFGISATYHRGRWSPRWYAALKRLDHANIFLIIAGTYTPFAVLLLHGSSQLTLLLVVWVGAILGVLFKVAWPFAPRWVGVPLYLTLGWIALFYLPEFVRRGGVAVVLLIALGGLLYTAGGVIYGLKRPNPSPQWFGFHEVFHAFTLGAFVAHYAAVAMVVLTHA